MNASHVLIFFVVFLSDDSYVNLMIESRWPNLKPHIFIDVIFIINCSKLLEETTVRALAAQHSKSTAQVLLKWALQHDVGK